MRLIVCGPKVANAALLLGMDDGTGIIRVVAETVRRARKAAGLSQEELALEAGLDRTYISQVERGYRRVIRPHTPTTALGPIAGIAIVGDRQRRP